MSELVDSFTSTGAKLFWHQQAMQDLRAHKGTPIVTHIMPTDLCQHKCAFCSVATREGSLLRLPEISGYLDQLLPFGLKAVILSGGGNPLLYRCQETDAGFNELVEMIAGKGLEIGLITNGMRLKQYPGGRISWSRVAPETLDRLKWIRISMAGLDHEERAVHVPDVLPEKTTLGFSYVYHDRYDEPLESNHGAVSTEADLVTPLRPGDGRAVLGSERLPWLKEQIGAYVRAYKPAYVRLLPNCLEPDKIAGRCQELQRVADAIDPAVVFVQHKPPKAPNVCYLGYFHPVLNSDGFVYPCDSCVLNAAAGHKFAVPWRICHWSAISSLFTEKMRSLVEPKALCPGCVFTKTNLLLESVYNGAETPAPSAPPEHFNFI